MVAYDSRPCLLNDAVLRDNLTMGHRLSKIYTRTGDAGTTGLGDGSRTGKDSARVAAMGDVDELNSLLGIVLCEAMSDEVRELLIGIQHDLFDLGGELSVPGANFLAASQPGRLEQAIDRYNGELQPLKEFILPGGTRVAAQVHLARAVCRRAERKLVTLASTEAVSDTARRYLNRLSDLLFVLARWLNKSAGGGDVLWQKGKNAGL
ncbi:Cobalamin adenosyltransferase [Denitratisoma oestradiolicum]|uniref:Cobalamin adenosyltransferase n=2 Tax=Denitratisoma oestradiolicum TaxID=311182 RepID=A0A6S6YBJ0_9PROT|nr:Cobalamin adenosyltransferase [Denitratisoma oestradiolicum]